jgi:hypothetical protein
MFEVITPPIKEIFPNLNEGTYFSHPSYSELFKGINASVVLTYDVGSYQGSSWLLFRAKGCDLYGFLEFGWGSCSGCDALQACDSYEDLDKLRHRLINSIVWNSVSKTVKFLREKDWETMSDGSVGKGEEFVKQALPLLLTEKELKTMDILES